MSTRRWLAVPAAGLLAVGIVGHAVARPSGSACENPKSQPRNLGSGKNKLAGVDAISGCKAWAVGYSNRRGRVYRTLVEYWNGKAWKIQPSPSRGFLLAVSATSPSSAWAAGDHAGSLIEHWDGTSWTVEASPKVGTLNGVAATSPTNAWAVGQRGILHWDGTAWGVQPSPGPGSPANRNLLKAVAATSPTNAWAVGEHYNYLTGNYTTLIERWDGTAWTVQPSPNPRGSVDDLDGVAATSPTNAWAVGSSFKAVRSYKAVIEHWDGTAWTAQPSPDPGGPGHNDHLLGVTATSATSAWAVGYYGTGSGHSRTFVLRWNGTAWKILKTPSPGKSAVLSGVAATSATNVWAAGSHKKQGGVDRTLALRWNGTAWAP